MPAPRRMARPATGNFPPCKGAVVGALVIGLVAILVLAMYGSRMTQLSIRGEEPRRRGLRRRWSSRAIGSCPGNKDNRFSAGRRCRIG